MDCKYCDGKTKVIDTRQSPIGKIRRRECKQCHKRFTTVEREKK